MYDDMYVYIQGLHFLTQPCIATGSICIVQAGEIISRSAWEQAQLWHMHCQAFGKWCMRIVSYLSKCLHVVLCSHFQHGAATAHADVVLNELHTCAVQCLDLKVLSQGADG